MSGSNSADFGLTERNCIRLGGLSRGGYEVHLPADNDDEHRRVGECDVWGERTDDAAPHTVSRTRSGS